jgi:V8-like Glu-specific endopeptidase
VARANRAGEFVLYDVASKVERRVAAPRLAPVSQRLAEMLKDIAPGEDPAVARAKLLELIHGPGAAAESGQPGAGMSAEYEDEPPPPDFGGRSRITPADYWPYSAVVRLSYKKAGVGKMASGILIDSKWVLTAGHCVHEGDGGDWVTNMVVSPAYDAGSVPFGTASAVNLGTWTGWSRDGDYDDDIGVIELDRHVGAVTGYAGYGYSTSWSFFDDSTFYMRGYPAEGGYSGKQMYSISGNFDRKSGDHIKQMDKDMHGGESGAAFTVSNTAYAVHSHSYSDDTSGAVALWESYFKWVRDDLIAPGVPSSVDLVPVEVRTSSSTLARGAKFTTSFVLHNYSKSSFSGSVGYKVYLSNDSDIDSTDTPLVSVTSTGHALGAKKSKWLSTASAAIPSTAGTGTRYIGVILQNSDANNANNDGTPQDAHKVTIY